MYVCMYVCMNVWVYVLCMYVCMNACMNVWVYVYKCIHLYVYLYVNKNMHVYYYVYDCILRCICANVSVYSTSVYSKSETAYEWYMYLMYLYVYASVKYMLSVGMSVCTYEWMYECMEVCMDACMCACGGWQLLAIKVFFPATWWLGLRAMKLNAEPIRLPVKD